MAHILAVDDEVRMRELLSIMLQRKGHKVDQAGNGADALEMIKRTPYEMIITDIRMPRMDGIALLQQIKELNLQIPVVFITAFATVDSAVEAMRQGAADYITKPFEEERIVLTIERTLNLSRIMAENKDLKEQIKRISEGEEIVYASDKMKRVMDLAARVSETDSHVLITGESGTGKELLARFIHQASRRKEERFVPVNCAAISPNLVESELFGHEKGAFTGADRRVLGKFEYASGGTLFLDEIADLPLEAQAKLLRALEDKKIRRVGGNEEMPVDLRVVCATNRDIRTLSKNGSFRRDLYFRINVFPIEPPPLRERLDDISVLAQHFLQRFSGGRMTRITEDALKLLCSYSWPGNVRELANVMERAAILSKGREAITSGALGFLRQEAFVPVDGGEGDFKLPPEGIRLEELERSLVRQALSSSGGNQSAAAKLLGLTRAKFRVLLRKENGDGNHGEEGER